MCRAPHVLHPAEAGLGNRYVMQWIEEFDGHLKFFLKEFAHVRHPGTAATQENASRAISLLLSAVVRNRAHQFCMKTGHGAARDFRNPAYIGIGRFGVSAPEPYKPVLLFTSFCRGERFVELPRDRTGNRAARQRNAAQENSSRLDEKNVRGPRTDIQEQGAVAYLGVAVAKRVVERHRRNVDDRRP